MSHSPDTFANPNPITFKSFQILISSPNSLPNLPNRIQVSRSSPLHILAKPNTFTFLIQVCLTTQLPSPSPKSFCRFIRLHNLGWSLRHLTTFPTHSWRTTPLTQVTSDSASDIAAITLNSICHARTCVSIREPC